LIFAIFLWIFGIFLTRGLILGNNLNIFDNFANYFGNF